MSDFWLRHKQKVRFVVVGGINTTIDMGLFMLLTSLFGVIAEWASVMSTSVAIVFSFFANYYYVWGSKKSKSHVIIQFLAVTLTTAWLVQTGVIWAVRGLLGGGDAGWVNLLAKICAIAVGMVVNYLLYKVIFVGVENGKK